MIIPLVIVLDQISKIIAVKLGFVTSCNTGFAFGIAPGFLTTLISFLVLGVVFYLARREKRQEFLFGYYLILGGGLSNLIDRLLHGCVLDFINLKIWPNFNLADASISVGVGLLIILFVKGFKNA